MQSSYIYSAGLFAACAWAIGGCAILYDFEGAGGGTAGTADQTTATQTTSVTSTDATATTDAASSTTGTGCAVCAPFVGGAVGPFVRHTANDAPPSCTKARPMVSGFTAVSGNPVGCNCSCVATSAGCTARAAKHATDCSGFASPPVTLFADTCTPFVGGMAGVEVASYASEGECNGVAIETERPDPVMTGFASLCDDAPSCDQGRCFDTPAEACVLSTDDTCPSAYPFARTYYTDVVDGRTCEACTCNDGGGCSGQVEVFSDPDCSGQTWTILGVGCVPATVSSVWYTQTGEPQCTAVPGTGGAKGDVVLKNDAAFKVCCMGE